MKRFSEEKLSLTFFFFWRGVALPVFMFWWNFQLYSVKRNLGVKCYMVFSACWTQIFSKDEPYCQPSPEWSLRERNNLTNVMTMNLDLSVYELYCLLPLRHGGKMTTVLRSSWTEVHLPGMGILWIYAFRATWLQSLWKWESSFVK